MSWGAFLCIFVLLIFWVVIAWAMLAAMPKDVCDWRDQLAFAFWPFTLLGLVCEALYRHATRRLRTPKVAALDLRKPKAQPAECQGCDAAASPGDLAGGDHG